VFELGGNTNPWSAVGIAANSHTHTHSNLFPLSPDDDQRLACINRGLESGLGETPGMCFWVLGQTRPVG